MSVLLTPGEYQRLAGRIEERNGCWVWIDRVRPKVLHGKPGKRILRTVEPVSYVRGVCGFPTRTGKSSKPQCGNPACVHPGHWRTKPKSAPRQPPPRKLTHDIAATIRSEYRALCRRILDDHNGDKHKAQAAVRFYGDRRVSEFFARMMALYNLGRSTVRHAAYGTRGGLSKN